MARKHGIGPWATAEEGSLLLAAMLWTTDRLRFFYVALGVDYPALRELLRVRVLLGMRTSVGNNTWGMVGIVLAVLMTWLTGMGTGMIAVMSKDASVWVVVSQSVLALMLALLLFQHLAGVLVDPTDIGVVAPHPVSDRTVFAVRLSEVFAYLLIFVASFTAGNLMIAVFAKPLLPVLFIYPLLSLLCGVTTLGAVTLLFALCLRIVGPAYFQRVTLWVQILGGALIFGGMQLRNFLPRVTWAPLLEKYAELRYLWPPVQYAEIFAIASGSGTRFGIAIGIAAVLLPIAALAATLWLASHYFVAGLQGTLGAPIVRSGWQRGWIARLGEQFTRGEERAGFGFALALSRREPHFLRGVLPQLVMFQFMALGMGFGMREDKGMAMPISAGFLFMVLPNLLMLGQATATPDARQLFSSTPLESEAAFLRGGVKALLLQWIALPAIGVIALHLVVGGVTVLPGIVLALELSGVCILFFTRRYDLALPFTQPIRLGQSGAANFGLILVSGLVLVLLVAVHMALSMNPIAMSGGILAAGLLLIVLWRQLDRLRPAPSKRLDPTRL
ncbi:MAG TPA: hypothetical protein VK843_10505 [Planctomycetota bacterium]|nr:hypothetical protein [Planctomycetota bacterium]